MSKDKPAPPGSNGPGGLPNPGAPGSGPNQGCPHGDVHLTHETVHTSPPNRQRTRIGVGESVRLTVTPGPGSWRLDGPGALDSQSGNQVTYQADDLNGRASAKATIGVKAANGCVASVTFAVLAPRGVFMDTLPERGFYHVQGHMSAGFVAQVYITPHDVNFDAVRYIEEEVGAVGTGGYTFMNGKGHSPHTSYLSVDREVVAGKGSPGGIDRVKIDMTWTGSGAPAPGTVTWSIPWKYEVEGGAFSYRMTVVDQVATMDAQGTTIIRKSGGASPPFARNAPSSKMDESL